MRLQRVGEGMSPAPLWRFPSTGHGVRHTVNCTRDSIFVRRPCSSSSNTEALRRASASQSASCEDQRERRGAYRRGWARRGLRSSIRSSTSSSAVSRGAGSRCNCASRVRLRPRPRARQPDDQGRPCGEGPRVVHGLKAVADRRLPLVESPGEVSPAIREALRQFRDQRSEGAAPSQLFWRRLVTSTSRQARRASMLSSRPSCGRTVRG